MSVSFYQPHTRDLYAHVMSHNQHTGFRSFTGAFLLLLLLLLLSLLLVLMLAAALLGALLLLPGAATLPVRTFCDMRSAVMRCRSPQNIRCAHVRHIVIGRFSTIFPSEVSRSSFLPSFVRLVVVFSDRHRHVVVITTSAADEALHIHCGAIQEHCRARPSSLGTAL